MTSSGASSNPASETVARIASTLSPLGVFTVAESGGAIVRVWLPGESSGRRADSATPLLKQALAEIAEFIAGKRRSFTVPTALAGTPFQRAVWTAIDAIPYGRTATYGEIAARIGRPTAVRAVAAACGRNPVAVFTPCHRVVAANGLGGFRGGLALKQALLALEQRRPDQTR